MVGPKADNEAQVVQNGSIVGILWLLFWFLSTIALFALFYAYASARFANEEQLEKVLGNIGWPFAVLSLAVPITYILSTNLRHLLDLKKTIDDAPVNLAEALRKLEEFQSSLEAATAQVNNDLEAREGRLSRLIGQMDAKESQLSHILGQNVSAEAHALGAGNATGETALQATALERLAAHLEAASNRFYEALDKANSDRRRTRNPLVVKPGGFNRPELVEDLRAGKYFDRNDDRNNALADFIAAAFNLEMDRRRKKPPTEASIMNLDELRQAAEKLGGTLSS